MPFYTADKRCIRVKIMTYAVITFSPVQGFIEKSRKLRDLYGASIILSYLSQQLVEAAKTYQLEIISPGLVNVAQGMPNRILIKGDFSQHPIEAWVPNTLLGAWKAILSECKQWIEHNIPEHSPDFFYHWHRDWEMWGTHTWEIFWGSGNSIPEAMEDLETRKLSRNWTGINWIGESSSLTGIDAIAWPGLGSGSRNPKTLKHSDENAKIESFYAQLATVLETPSRSISGEDEQLVEGKFLDPHERLSIPELVKRLITRYEIRRSFEKIPALKRFSDLERKPDPEKNHSGQWTGWFMGDGDKVGKKLKKIADQNGDQGLQSFSKSMRTWGRDFMQKFPSDLGRVIYAGGDDFLGVIYSKNPNQPIPPQRALKWLMELNNEWKTHKQEITLSVGFVWAGHSVPQRDVLQHCREAEKQAKSLGRDRVTLRIVFNSGQYVEWTCPWEHLSLLNQYRDRNGGQNWSQVYSDLAQLKARHSIEPKSKNPDYKLALALMNIYFQNSGEMILRNQQKLVGNTSPTSLLQWIENLILVGWQLCSSVEP